MTVYKAIQGFAVQNVAGDPTTNAGQVWYNSVASTFRLSKGPIANVWASSPSLNTPRQGMTGSGSNTSMLVFGGYPPTTSTESWNNSAWTAAPAMNTARESTGAGGNNTDAVAMGGYTNTAVGTTETFNGSWTTGNPMSTARYASGGAGFSSSGSLVFGGDPVNKTNTESFNGSWTNTGNLNTGQSNNAGSGSQDRALSMGGQGASSVVERYTTGTWTAVQSLNTGRQDMAAAGDESNGPSIVFGGQDASPAVTGATELWNGSNAWTTGNSMATARKSLAGSIASPATAALAAGGSPLTAGATVEVWAPGGGTFTLTTT